MYRVYISIADYLQSKRDEIPIVRDKFSGNLKIGNSGDEVRNLQHKINAISNYENIPSVSPTGYFGPKTKVAVNTFQKNHRLTQSGAVDARTYNSIDEEYRRIVPSLVVNFDQYPGYELKLGMDDFALQNEFKTLSTPIYNVQSMLRQSAFNNREIPFIIPDGYFGIQTENAVRSVQKFYDLNDDGIIDLVTFEAIRNEYDKSR